MGHFRLLRRLARLVLVELTICLLIAALIWSIIDNLTYGTDRLLVLGSAGAVAFVAVLFFAHRLSRRPSDAHGTAAFATPADIGRAGLRSRGVILGKKSGRFVRFDRPGHLLTFAPTRLGKGVGVVIPNLLDHPGSVVVTDIKGENYRVTARHRGTAARSGRCMPSRPSTRTLKAPATTRSSSSARGPSTMWMTRG